jgi:hypothetical protein
MMDLFLEGGVAMWFITLFGVVALVAAALHAAFARKWSFIVGIVNVPLPPIIGLAGWWYGSVEVAEAVAFVDPSLRAELEAQGYAEARVPLIYGAIVLFVCLVPFVIGVARHMGRAARQPHSTPQ